MKITSLKTYPVPPRWLFLKIETDEGIIGWGEPVIEGRARTVAAAVEELADYLIGQDPLRIEDHWQILTRGGFYRGGPILSSAVAGIDQALWDIAGKTYDLPVHQLLGGHVRDTVRVYSWIGGDEPAATAEHAAQRVEQGFTAVKMNASGRIGPLATPRELDDVLERVRAVREVMGPDGGVAIDFHGRLTPPVAKQLCQLLEPMRPMFVEEPIVPELSADLGRICESTSVPIATGERSIPDGTSGMCWPRASPSPNPTCHMPVGSPSADVSQPWPRRTASPWHPTAHSDRSPLLPACRSTSPRPTP